MKTILLLLLPATLSFQPSRQTHNPQRLQGAAADFITEAFGATPEDSADAERRIIGASPGPVAQLFAVARAPDETTDADDAALLEARCGEVRAELASRTAGLAALGLSAAEVKRTVGRVPEVLAYSAATTARAAAALKARLALDDVAFKKKIALRLPQALGLSYDADVAPELDALQAGLDLCDAELRALVLGAPQILGLSYEADVAPSGTKSKSSRVSFPFDDAGSDEDARDKGVDGASTDPPSPALSVASRSSAGSDKKVDRDAVAYVEYDLRWFTRSGVEVDLCGHATLAAAHALYELGPGTVPDGAVVRFHLSLIHI